ncbi:hypothetical protein D9M68_527330 [compost metagenome]
MPADDLRQPRSGTVPRISDAQELRLFRFRRSLRADLRPVGRDRLWRQVRRRRTAGDDAENLAPGAGALCRPHHDQHRDAGDFCGRGDLFRPAGSDRRDQHSADGGTDGTGHRRHGASGVSARLQQHPVDVCGAVPDAAGYSLAERRQQETAAVAVGRPVARRRHLQVRAVEFPRRGLLVPQSLVLAVPVRHRHRHDDLRSQWWITPPMALADRPVGRLSCGLRCLGALLLLEHRPFLRSSSGLDRL